MTLTYLPTKTTWTLAALLLAASGTAFAQAPDPAPAPPPATTAPPAAPPDNAPPASPAPEPKRRGFQIPKIGIDVGVFLPSDSKTRSRFGKSWSNIGIGFGRVDTPAGTGRIGFDFSIINKKSGDHHAFVAPIGVSYRRAFNANDVLQRRTLIPYYGVSANLVGLDLRSPEDNVHSGLRLGYGGSAVVGTTIGASGFAEARYLGISKTKGFNLSGLNLTVGVRF